MTILYCKQFLQFFVKFSQRLTNIKILKPSLTNKFTIYKSIIRPVWTYGIQFWNVTKPSYAKTLQAFLSVCMLRLIFVANHRSESPIKIFIKTKKYRNSINLMLKLNIIDSKVNKTRMSLQPVIRI